MTPTTTIVHIAEHSLDEETGLGRIACSWKRAAHEAGHDFVHIGPEEVGPLAKKELFPAAAFKAWQAMNRKADAFLVHELSSSGFVDKGTKTIVFSHGLERRGWELMLKGNSDWNTKVGLRTRLLYPMKRLANAEAALKKADALFLSNTEDQEFAVQRYHLDGSKVWLYRNGLFPSGCDESTGPKGKPNVLYMGAWTERKGIHTLARAADLVRAAGVEVNWILAGVSIAQKDVLKSWPEALASVTKVIPRFDTSQEPDIITRAHIFVLPSFFEGQPLGLLQAMEAGRCCIVSNCCGQKDLVQDGQNGLVHAPGDANALAQLIVDCAGNETLRQELGMNARLSVGGRDWESTGREVIAKIESIAALKN